MMLKNVKNRPFHRNYGRDSAKMRLTLFNKQAYCILYNYHICNKH